MRLRGSNAISGLPLKLLKKGSKQMELYEGRPQNAEGRLEKEMRAYDLLDSLDVSYVRVDHEPAMTMDVCVDIDAALGATMCKNLFLCNRQKTEFYMLLMPGDKPFKTKDLSSQIGTSRLSFGETEYMERFLELTPGSVSVLGLMNDRDKAVRLLIDEDILNAEYVGVHPCVKTSSIRISIDDLLGKLLPAMNRQFITVTL